MGSEMCIRDSSQFKGSFDFSEDVFWDLVKFCLTNCYFTFRSEFYIQMDGVAMGSGVGCTVANLYIF